LRKRTWRQCETGARGSARCYACPRWPATPELMLQAAMRIETARAPAGGPSTMNTATMPAKRPTEGGVCCPGSDRYLSWRQIECRLDWTHPPVQGVPDFAVVHNTPAMSESSASILT